MEMLDITQVIEALLTLVIAIVGVVYTRYRQTSTNADQLGKWVEIAVYAAEQAYKTGMTHDRKNSWIPASRRRSTRCPPAAPTVTT